MWLMGCLTLLAVGLWIAAPDAPAEAGKGPGVLGAPRPAQSGDPITCVHDERTDETLCVWRVASERGS